MKKNKTPEQDFKEWFYKNCTKKEKGEPVVRLTPEDLYKRMWERFKFYDKNFEENILEQMKMVHERMGKVHILIKEVSEILNKL